MIGKLITGFLIITSSLYVIHAATLRRTPKVYNALITTDENITSSRAFPVIQPTVYQGGISHYPFGPYSPYGVIVRYAPPIVPNLNLKPTISYPLPHGQFPPQIMTQSQFPPQLIPQTHFSPQPMPQPQPQSPAEDVPPTHEQHLSEQDSILTLNENQVFQYPNRVLTSASLPSYHFQQFPTVNDGLTGHRSPLYLPHFGYFPGHSFASGIPAGPSRVPPPLQTPISPNNPFLPTTPSTPTDVDDATDENDILTSTETPAYTTELNFEHIKNGSKSKDKNVPDVPPPPIPSGAKLVQN